MKKARVRRLSLPHCLLLVICLAVGLASACKARAVSGFTWKGPSGASLPFSETSSWPEGEEGRFSGGHLANRYVLITGLPAPPASSIVVAVRRAPGGGRGRVSLALSPRRDGSSPQARAEFALSADLAYLFLPLEAGSIVASLGVSAPEGGAGLIIESVAFGPAFRGIDTTAGALRLGSDFGAAQAPGYRLLSIARPFEGLSRRAGLLLDYGIAERDAAMRIEAFSRGAAPRAYTLRCHPSGGRTSLELSLFPPDTERLELRVPPGIELRAFYAAELAGSDFELADLGRVLLAARPEGDFSVYRWDLLPEVLVLDFKDYATQDRYLKRLAFFVEKSGYRGSLPRDEELAPLHGWNAHDYGSEDLAAFFRKAGKRSFPLNDGEKELEALLVDKGLLAVVGSGVEARKGAIFSISQESSSSLRWTFAVHESTHAIFFSDPAYRGYAQALWASLDSSQRWFWRTYLGWAGYDPSSDFLMGNEFQAYLLQQPVAAAEEYFTKRKSAELLEKHPELKERVDAYMATYGSSFAHYASQLEAWLRAKYGIEAGRTIFLTLSKP